MTIHVKQTGSTGSWVRIAITVTFVVVVLATGYLGLGR